MAALGSLVVQLGLNYAQFTGGADAAEQRALQMSKRVQDTMDGLKSTVATTIGAIAGGLAAGFTIAAFKGLISGTIESSAALHDLASQTGASVEALSGLAAIGKYSEQSAEDIGNAMNKLAKNMAGATEESKGTGKALDALGIDFDKFKKMSPDQQMLAVAKAMDQFKDGSGKSAVAMALFGKEGAKMIPFFKDLAEVGELQAKVTTEQSAAADNFDDNLKKTRASGEAWKKELALGMIPALDTALTSILGVTNGTGGLRDTVKALVADGSIKTWTEGAIKGFSYLIDAGQAVVAVIRTIAAVIRGDLDIARVAFETLGDAASKAAEGDLKGAWQSIKAGASTVKDVVKDTATEVQDLWGAKFLGARFREELDKNAAAASATSKKVENDLDFTNVLDKDKNAAAAAGDAMAALIEQIKGRDKLQLAQAKETTEELKSLRKRGALGEIEAIEQVADAEIKALATSRALMTEELAIYGTKQNGQKDVAVTKARIAEQDEKIGAREKQLNRELLESYAQYNAEADKRLDGRYKDTAALDKQLEQLEFEAKTIGATAEQVRLLEAARTEEMAVALERQAVTRRLIDGNSAEADQLERQAELLRKIAGQKGANGIAAEAASQWKTFTDSLYNGLTDSLYRGFEAGKGFFSSFWDGIKNTFKTTILKFMVQAIIGLSASSLGIAGASAGAINAGNSVLGLASNASSAYGLASGNTLATATNIYNGAVNVINGGSFAAGYGSAGATAASNAALGFAEGGVGASSAAASTGSSLLGNIATAAPYAIAAVVALNALGVFRSEKKTDVGFKGVLGAESDVSGFTTIRKGGTLFSGPSYRDELSALPAATKLAIDQSVGSMFSSVKGFSDVLGLNSKAIDGFTKDIFISTQGLTDAQIQEKLAATFKSLGDDLANLVAGGILSGAKAGSAAAAAAIQEDAAGALPVAYAGAADPVAGGQTVSAASALDPFRRAGESAIDTLGRLANSLSGANAIFDSLGQTALKASLAGGAAASALVDLFGGMDKFSAAAGSFLQDFYTPAEQAAITTRQLTTEFDKLGVTLPKSRDAYREMVELYQTKLDTEEGRKMYAALLQFAPVFASITDAANDAPASVASKAERDKAIADKTYDYEQQILRAQGKDREALDRDRAKEYAAAADLSPALAKLANDLWEVQDAATAAAAAQALANAARDQDIQIMELQGNAAGALAARRDIELAGMDPLLREKQRYIYALQDEAAATAAAAQAKAEADARAKEIGDTQFDYEQRLLRAQGRDREALDRDRAKEYARLMALSPALAVLANNLWLAEDAATAAAAAQAELDDAYSAVQRAVDARKTVLSEMQSVQQAAVTGLGAIAQTLKSSIGSLLGEVTSVTAVTAANGMAYLRKALISGVSSNEELQAAIAGVRANMGEDKYATREEYDRDRLVLAGQLSELEEVNGVQLTTAEKQLKTTQDELKRLDDMLRESKTLVDTMKGVDTSVLSVAEAIDRLHKALVPAKPAGATTGAAGSSAGGAVVGAGPGGGSAGGGSALGRQADGTYVFSDGYVNRVIAGAAAANLAGLDAVFAEYAGSGDVAGYYAAAKAAGYSLRDVAAHDGYFYGDVLAAAAGAGVPAFEAGGMHAGGLRIVGERGWELEASGQSRIWNQQQLAAAFGGGGAAANDQIVVELRALSLKVEALQKAADTTADNTRDIVKSIRNVTADDGKAVLMKAAA